MISVSYDDGFNIFPFHKCYIAVQELLVLFFCFFFFFLVCVCVVPFFYENLIIKWDKWFT